MNGTGFICLIGLVYQTCSATSSQRDVIVCWQALGCLLYRMAFFKSCFDGESKLQVLNGRYSIPENHKFSAPVITLIRDMLAPTPDARPSVLEVRRVQDLQPAAEVTG